MISASNHPEAIEFLLALVEDGSERESNAAAKAFEVHRDAPEIQARLKAALESRG
jgi:hypothetical protein